MNSSAAVTNRLRFTLDSVERVVVLALYLFLIYRFAVAAIEQPVNWVYIVNEGLIVLMVLLRRSTDQISIAPRDWFIAFAGTFASMLLIPGEMVEGLGAIAGACLLFGFLLSITAKLFLRRSFGLVAANRGIKTGGIYGLVRHPMYLGYTFIQAGTLMINFNLWNAAIVAVWFAFEILRIEAEEKVLAQDEAYRAHMARVRYKLLPGLY